MAGRLWVFLSDRRIGVLDEVNNQLTYTYESNAEDPLSVKLPIRTEPYGDSECRPFFNNLLPEGSWRQAICRQLRIDENNDFALLSAIGSECAGAVALESNPDWTSAQETYKETSEKELRRWVLNPVARPTIQTTPGLRLSLAGAQDKLLFHLYEGKPYLCEGGAPSSVILKPDIHDLHNAVQLSAFNELLCTMLAQKCGLNVVRPFWYASAYAVHRFDRKMRIGKPIRLHQEDFAQIAGVPSGAKYEEHGGPGWGNCFDILDTYTAVPARDRLELLYRLFFNICIGNNDAHAKNFALLHDPQSHGANLAPAYDLVCTQIYPTLSQFMAMKIGGRADPAQLDGEAWVHFCEETGFTQASIRRLGLEIANRIQTAIGELQSEVEETSPTVKADIYPGRRRAQFFAAFARVIRTNCNLLIKSLQ